MKKLFRLLIVALASPLLGGCLDGGSSAAPPAAFTATAEDGRVKLEWIASPGVNYWLFTATDPSLTAYVWANLPNAHIYQSAASPFYMCGLLDGTTYYFAANGRIDGGPGGASSPTISATPSPAGGTWSITTTSPAQNLYGVGYAGLMTCSNNAASAAGSFAAAGAGGAIFTSPDGATWASQTSPVTTDLYAVTGYAANQNNPGNPALRWVAVGAGGVSVYSTDGSTWLVGRADLGNPALRSLTRVGGTFFAVGDAGTILSSTDGITWISRTSGTTNNLNGITYGGILVAVGDGGTILSSADGNIWTSQVFGTANLKQISSIGNTYVAVGDSGTIAASIAGGAWIQPTLTVTPNLVGIAANSRFIVADSSGNAYTSTDGLTWSAPIATGATQLNTLSSSGFGYVAAGNAGVTANSF